MKKIILGFFLLGNMIFACSTADIHTTALMLINGGVARISGNYFIINESKVNKFIGKDSLAAVLLSLAVYPKEHNLITKYE